MNDEFIASGRLTKKFYLSIAPGLFLMSNTFGQALCPVFAEQVATDDKRAVQWQRIVACRAAQRMCRVFPDKATYVRWNDRIYTDVEKRDTAD